MERFEKMVDSLSRRDHRMTPQRLAILRILATSPDHPSAEMIFDKIKQDFPYTSFATVYKTIALAKEMGEVIELEFSQDSNRYDGQKPYPHPHLICTACKKVLDPDLDTMSHLEAEINRETGFKITHHRLDFFGLCPECQKKR